MADSSFPENQKSTLDEERLTGISRSSGISARSTKIHYITITAMLSAVAFILQFMELPFPLMPVFVKLDFSDLPALLGAFALGPVSGVVIELIKNLLHSLVSQSFGVGEICNFMLGAAFVIPAGLIYKHSKTKKSAIIGAVVGAVIMAAFSVPSNMFITYPFYYQFMPEETILAMYQALPQTFGFLPQVNSIPQALLLYNMPFTFFKAALCVIITFLIYKPLSPLLHGRRK